MHECSKKEWNLFFTQAGALRLFARKNHCRARLWQHIILTSNQMQLSDREPFIHDSVITCNPGWSSAHHNNDHY